MMPTFVVAVLFIMFFRRSLQSNDIQCTCDISPRRADKGTNPLFAKQVQLHLKTEFHNFTLKSKSRLREKKMHSCIAGVND